MHSFWKDFLFRSKHTANWGKKKILVKRRWYKQFKFKYYFHSVFERAKMWVKIHWSMSFNLTWFDIQSNQHKRKKYLGCIKCILCPNCETIIFLQSNTDFQIPWIIFTRINFYICFWIRICCDSWGSCLFSENDGSFSEIGLFNCPELCWNQTTHQQQIEEFNQKQPFAPGQTAVSVEVEHWWTYIKQYANQI